MVKKKYKMIIGEKNKMRKINILFIVLLVLLMWIDC